MIGWIYYIFIGVLLMASYVLGIIGLGNPDLEKNRSSKVIMWGLVVISVAFVLFALFLPIVMPQFLKNVDVEIIHYNELGDAIGGLMSPFIAIAAVIVTGLAFYMLYQTNQQIRDQFKLQQFENQLYEMLSLHKENVHEIELDVAGLDPPTKIRGRKVFVIYVLEFHKMLEQIGVSDLEQIDQDSFSQAYRYFFVGLGAPTNEDLQSIGRNPSYYKLLDNCKNDALSTKYRFPLFEGHVEYLGHYYRHLYMTVKYVVESFEKEKILTSEGDCL